MRKLLLLLITVLSLSGCMSAMVKTQQNMMESMRGKVEDEELAMEIIDSTTIRAVFNVNSTIKNSIKKIPLWIDENFNKLETSIYRVNSEEKSITGNGTNILTIEVMNFRTPTEFHFEYSFEIKENRIRFTIREPYYYVVVVDKFGYEMSKPTKTYVDEDTLRRMSRGINEKSLLENLSKYIEGIEESDDDW